MTDQLTRFANASRTFLQQCRHGLLSTISLSQGGFPFGSIAPYDITKSGDIIIYISLIAEHYKNLSADPRASLVAANYLAYEDPQAFARATVLCRFEKVSDGDTAAIQASYEARFPDSINHEISHNFLFMRGIPERIRWIGGFGDIGWVSQDRYRATQPDPLAYESYDILQHMNEDHSDALNEYVKAYGGYEPKSGTLRMIEISSGSFTILHAEHGSYKTSVINFPAAVTSAEECRSALIKLLKEARR